MWIAALGPEEPAPAPKHTRQAPKFMETKTKSKPKPEPEPSIKRDEIEAFYGRCAPGTIIYFQVANPARGGAGVLRGSTAQPRPASTCTIMLP